MNFSFADVLSGYNGTIFAYGQTSSGKTHTMEVIRCSTISKFLWIEKNKKFQMNSYDLIKQRSGVEFPT